MPPDFDSVTWDKLGVLYGRHFNKPPWDGLANAHNGIAFRFQAATAADERFSAAFSLSGGDRCLQEDGLFSFFFNAVSCVECALYGLHHLGALVEPARFPIATPKDLANIKRDAVRQRFLDAFPAESLTVAIGATIDDHVFKQLLESRDVLAHRGSIPRNHRVVMRVPGHVRIPRDVDAAFMAAKPKSLGGQSPVVELDGKTTARLRVWLASALRRVVEETLCFAEAHLPPT